MIECGRCRQTLPPDEFAPTRRNQGNYCKNCINLRVKALRAVGNRIVSVEKLKRGACTDCGMLATPDNLVVFDFDHRDRLEKSGPLGPLKGDHRALVAELAKCDMRCANCHRLKTARDQDYVPLAARKAAGAQGPLFVACICCGRMHSRRSLFCTRRCLERAAYRESVGIPIDVEPFTVRAKQTRQGV